jgi:flagellar hook-associated protein 2
LKTALSTSLSDVQSLFGTVGTATDGRISFVSGTDASQPGTYAIQITAAATQATHLGAALAGGVYSASTGVSDVLTITDSSSGDSVDYTVAHGATLAEIVAGITSAMAGEALGLGVEVDTGGLRFTATDHGTSNTFTLGGAAATLLGLTAGTYAGTDVEGTIGGLAATGTGRLLTGAAGGVTEGVSVRYTGTATGAAGELSYVLGVSGMMDRVLSPYIRSGDGTIANQLVSIDSTIEKLNRRANDVESRLQLRRETLTLQFTRMEQAMSLLNSQSTWLSGQVQAMNRSNN